jgi:hypothetical protein
MEGSQIELAVPYSTGSGNIFVPARIVYVQKFQDSFIEGAAYIPRNERENRSLKYEGSSIAVTKRELNS